MKFPRWTYSGSTSANDGQRDLEGAARRTVRDPLTNLRVLLLQRELKHERALGINGDHKLPLAACSLVRITSSAPLVCIAGSPGAGEVLLFQRDARSATQACTSAAR